MPTSDEFRTYAQECLRWAREATTDKEREAFFDMARAWTQAAAAQERRTMRAGQADEPRVSEH